MLIYLCSGDLDSMVFWGQFVGGSVVDVYFYVNFFDFIVRGFIVFFGVIS